MGEDTTFANNGTVGDDARAMFEEAGPRIPRMRKPLLGSPSRQSKAVKSAEAADAYKTLMSRGLPANVEAAVKQRLAAYSAQLSGAASPDADQAA